MGLVYNSRRHLDTAMRTAFMLKLRARNDPVHVAKRIQDTKKISLLEHRSDHTSVELAELRRFRSLLFSKNTIA